MKNYELSKIIGKLMRRPAFIPVPGFAMRLAFGEVANLVLSGQRVLPQRLLEHGFKFDFPTADDALTDLLRKS
jgi:NAD dependent epimerase/dehydratase family enzyme